MSMGNLKDAFSHKNSKMLISCQHQSLEMFKKQENVDFTSMCNRRDVFVATGLEGLATVVIIFVGKSIHDPNL